MWSAARATPDADEHEPGGKGQTFVKRSLPLSQNVRHYLRTILIEGVLRREGRAEGQH